MNSKKNAVLIAFSIVLSSSGSGCGGSTEPKIGPPASISVLSGDGQSGLAGSTLPQPLVVQVRDQQGQGVPGTPVKVVAATGKGSFTPDSTNTDAEGKATFVWVLGNIAVQQTAEVKSGTFSTQATATIITDYGVDLRFFGPTPSEQAFGAFVNAAARVRGMVIGDLANFNIPLEVGGAGLDLNECGIDGVVLNEVVDDLIIYATVRPIDGAGKTLAFAGPCYVRDAPLSQCVSGAQECYGPSIIGRMVFDSDDIANLVTSNRLQATVLHEMLHVVGVGTLWYNRPFFTGEGTTDPRFSGQRAITGCNEAGGAGICANGVPVENVGGPGSTDSHWRESVFDTELMTSISEGTGVPQPLSRMTIQSLADVGYSVNLLDADPYTIPVGSALKADIAVVDNAFDVVLRPQFAVTHTGSIRRLKSAK